MKKLKYSTNSWHYKFFENAYGIHDLPANLCDYFWMLVIAVLFIPITFVGRVINIFQNNSLDMFIQFSATSLFFLGCFAGNTLGVKLIHNNVVLATIVGTIIITISIIIFSLIFISMIMLYNKIINKFEKRKGNIKTLNPLIEGFKSFKGKYCSQIEWINEKTS